MHYLDLPYDVWEHITTFLSSEEARKLLDVNRTLFTITMNERYRTSTIGSLLQIDTRRNLARLTDPEVASRVYRLILKPGHICRAVWENARKKSTIETMPNRTTNIHKKTKASLSAKRMESTYVVSPRLKVPAEAAAQDLLSIMGLLKELRSLLIEIPTSEYRYFHQAPIPFFAVGWSTFRSSLRALELRVPVEYLALVLPDLSQGILPNLDTVALQIIRASIATQEGVIMVETILPFLQSHHQTLRSLTLEMAERTNLSPLLRGLHLPSLIHFRLVQPYIKQGEADYTGLQHFFKIHQSHLTHFEIGIGHPSVLDAASQPEYPFFSQECFTTPLPQLEHLSVDHGIMRELVISYIHQFESTLVSLKLANTHNWALSSVKLLVEGFVSSARLRRLDIPVIFFQPELLSVLATNLPNLETLNIGMLSILPRGQVFDPHAGKLVPQFPLEISTLSFPKWRLRNLNLQVTGVGPNARSAVFNLEKDQCKAALLKALPNVEIFCGLSRNEYSQCRDVLWFE